MCPDDLCGVARPLAARSSDAARVGGTREGALRPNADDRPPRSLRVFFYGGSSIKWIAITPGKWSNFSEMSSHFGAHIKQYFAQFILWCIIFGISIKALGYKLSEFYPAFVFIYVVSIVIFIIGAWDQAHH